MSRCRRNYEGIRSLAELQDERARLHFEVDCKKQEIASDLMAIKTWLSPSNVMSRVSERAYGSSSVFRSVLNGFYSVKSFFGRKKKYRGYDDSCDGRYHEPPQCDCGCGEYR